MLRIIDPAVIEVRHQIDAPVEAAGPTAVGQREGLPEPACVLVNVAGGLERHHLIGRANGRQGQRSIRKTLERLDVIERKWCDHCVTLLLQVPDELVQRPKRSSRSRLERLLGPNDAITFGRTATPFERAQLCSSDPLCSEHDPRADSSSHAAACHACQFASETSCERGNRYLDRATISATLANDDVSYFPPM